MTPRFLGVVALLAMGLCCSGLLHAQPQNEARARVLFEKGYTQLQDGEYVEALANFEQAYSQWPNPKILLNIATTLRQLGRFAEAAERYELYLAESEADATRVKEVEAALRDVEEQCGRLRVRLDDPRIEVRLNGKPIVPTPDGVRLDPGEHVVAGALDGETIPSISVSIKAGAIETVELEAPEPKDPRGTRHSPQPAPEPESNSRSHRNQIGVLAGVESLVDMSAAAGVFGLSYGMNDWLEAQVLGIAGRDGGGEPGACIFFSSSTVKPALYAGLPVFFADGARPGVHVSAGVHVDPFSSGGLFARGGIVSFASTPSGYDTTFVLWSAGVQGRF